ncbi:MAG: hypothetical protein VXW28_01620 [Candidatus Thermoplasmatota archaeon]|nr:hypothetical protein [Candidatus Thermoplasmatota archaeon]
MEIKLTGLILGNESDVEGYPLTDNMTKFVDELPIELIELLNKIALNGGGAWIVGGAVRDAFMGYMPTDIDLATDLIPDKLLSIFPDAIQTGVSFGTITIKSGQFQYQTTTLRTDGDYLDSRRPADVKWNLSLFEDLKRRDFTINSMAIDVARRRYYDPHDGVDDIKNKIIRSVGNAHKRIDEDALRILRAYRFLGQIEGENWQLESELRTAMKDNSFKIDELSKERTWEELNKILAFNNSGEILIEMMYDGILTIIFQWQHIEYGNLSSALSDSNNLDYISKFVLLNQQLGLEGIKQLCKSLKLSNNDLKNILFTYTNSLIIPQKSESYLRLYRHIIGDRWREVLSLSKVICKHRLNNNFDELNDDYFDQIISLIVDLPENKIPSQLIDGNWLMKTTNIGQGQKLGRLKEWLYRIQVENDLTNISDINRYLAKIQWQNSDFKSWPRMSLQ